MKKSITTTDKIVRAILGYIGTILQIPVLMMQYLLGLIWVAYSIVRRKDFVKIFDRTNENAISNVKWIIDEFKFYTF